MPSRPMVPCRAMGCKNLVVSGWCTEHQALAPANIYEQWRGSSTKRGYGYKWGQFRAWLLSQPDYALCRDCLLEGRVTVATQVHHPAKVKEHPELQFDPANCMPLCEPHHSSRTAKGE